FKRTQVTPKMCFVDVSDRGPERGHAFVPQRARLIEQRRYLFPRRFALFSADSQVKTAVTGSIRPSFAFDVERDDAPPVVESDAIDKRHEWRLYFLATNSDQIVLHSLRIINTFDAELIVYPKHNDTAAGVRESHDLLRDLFSVGKFYFELKKRVFSAANQPQQVGSRRLWCRTGEDVFL